MMTEKWTVLLLRPDYASDVFGHDTFCAHVTADSPGEALRAARETACKADDTDRPEDYYCLLCVKGWVVDWQDGRGGVVCRESGLLIALHDAINSPKGVVPDSALEYYDPETYEKRRP